MMKLLRSLKPFVQDLLAEVSATVVDKLNDVKADLLFIKQLEVLDPMARGQKNRDIHTYYALFSQEEMRQLTKSGDWALYVALEVEGEVENPLAWWESARQLPVLRTLALDLLHTPVHSGSVEGLFSMLNGLDLDPRRNMALPSKRNMLLCKVNDEHIGLLSVVEPRHHSRRKWPHPDMEGLFQDVPWLEEEDP